LVNASRALDGKEELMNPEDDSRFLLAVAESLLRAGRSDDEVERALARMSEQPRAPRRLGRLPRLRWRHPVLAAGSKPASI
jgi:hypothetical protein